MRAGAATTHKVRALGRQVIVQRICRPATDRHEAGLVAFTGYADHSFIKIDIFDSSLGEFGDPQATAIEKLDDGLIPTT